MKLKGKYLVLLTYLATAAALNSKINEIKGKMTNITNLATATAALTDVGNKIPNVSNLVKKTDYNTKISEIEHEITADHDHDKYITTKEFNKLTAKNFAARLAHANLARKRDIANFVKQTDSNKNKLNELSKKSKQYQQKDQQKM